MNLLIANDDGVYSPGLQVLAEVASQLGNVRIVAPDHEQSSMSHAVTLTRPLSYRKTVISNVEAFRVNGTPADCVALGINNWENVDAVLSGINLGYNLGNSLWHSGTLAAAKQAALFGVRGIALSAMPFERVEDYASLRPWVERVLRELLAAPPELRLINVNFPRAPEGMMWARQSVRHYEGKVMAATDPLGNPHFWFTAQPIEALDPDTDRAAVAAGMVAMTPLVLDLTDRAALDRLTAPPAASAALSKVG